MDVWEMTATVPLKVGDNCEFTKTISESDVYGFAGITGDFSRMHTDEVFMQTTEFGTRIVHGVLSFALGSTASTLIQSQMHAPLPSLSYGYDRLRFVKPVYIGDTLRATYTVREVDDSKLRSLADVRVYNQHGDVCVAATHILQFFEIDDMTDGHR